MDNSFDRIRAACSTDGLNYINEKQFERLIVLTNNNSITGEFFKIKNEVKTSIFGLTDITINFQAKFFLIDFTAKLCPDEYRNLINSKNILKYLNHFFSLNLLDFDTEYFIQNCQVSLIHCTRDIKVKNSPNVYFNAINYTIANSFNNFICDQKKNGIIITKNIKHKNLRLTIYDKFKELNRPAHKSISFLQQLSVDDLMYFQNTVRFELEIKKQEFIKKAFNIKNTTLFDIFHSDKNPVLEYFQQSITN